jgi:hypothetical protein
MSQSLVAPSRIKRAAPRHVGRLPLAPTPAREPAVVQKRQFTPAETRLIRKLRQDIQTGFDELQVVMNDIKKLLS